MAQADIFVVVTNIQFQRREGWQRRHKIQTQHGDQWLTVPVKGSQNQRIRDVRINTGFDWRRKHTKALEIAYARTRERETLHRLIEMYYENSWSRLVDLNMAFIRELRAIFGISTPVVLDEEIEGQKHQLVTRLCHKYGADTYLSGLGGKDYMDDSYMRELRDKQVACSFIPRNLTGEYPYTSLHYILDEGCARAREIVLCD